MFKISAGCDPAFSPILLDSSVVDKKHMASAYMFPLHSNNSQAEFPSRIQI